MNKYPYIDWLGYINSKMLAGLKFNESERVILQQPTYYDQLEDILNRTDIRTISNYVIWRELVDYIPYLNTQLRAMEFEFLKTVTGKSTKQSRWTDCIKSSSDMFGIAVSAMYVREHFRDQRIRNDVSQIIAEIKSEYEKILQTNDWMDEETKTEALKKLRSMHSNVAYPPELFNDTLLETYFANLNLSEDNYLQSAINVDNHGKEFVCERFHQPVNSKDWMEHSSTIYVNANYNGKTNSIRKINSM